MRAGCGVSRLGAWAAWARQGPPEPPLLAAPRRDAVIAAVAAALTAAAFIVAVNSSVLAHIQRVDDAWLRLMISGRTAPVTALAKVFNVLGLVRVADVDLVTAESVQLMQGLAQRVTAVRPELDQACGLARRGSVPC